jgi:hypothetical protein
MIEMFARVSPGLIAWEKNEGRLPQNIWVSDAVGGVEYEL